ncbi:hypothetical protein JCM15519_34600 [Fundidesulfovibrio butyratiphilus]
MTPLRPQGVRDWARPGSAPGETARDEAARRREILEKRAETLAQVPLEEVEDPGQLPALTFLVAGERYAIETSAVRQVAPAPEILPLPGTPPCIAGVIKMLGEVVSVTDLRALFGLPPKEADVKHFAILLSDREMAMAILAEEITGVRTLSRQDIASPLPTLTGVKADLLLGVTSNKIALLDAHALVTDKRLRAGDCGDQPSLA